MRRRDCSGHTLFASIPGKKDPTLASPDLGTDPFRGLGCWGMGKEGATGQVKLQGSEDGQSEEPAGGVF